MYIVTAFLLLAVLTFMVKCDSKTEYEDDNGDAGWKQTKLFSSQDRQLLMMLVPEDPNARSNYEYKNLEAVFQPTFTWPWLRYTAVRAVGDNLIYSPQNYFAEHEIGVRAVNELGESILGNQENYPHYLLVNLPQRKLLALLQETSVGDKNVADWLGSQENNLDWPFAPYKQFAYLSPKTKTRQVMSSSDARVADFFAVDTSSNGKRSFLDDLFVEHSLGSKIFGDITERKNYLENAAWSNGDEEIMEGGLDRKTSDFMYQNNQYSASDGENLEKFHQKSLSKLFQTLRKDFLVKRIKVASGTREECISFVIRSVVEPEPGTQRTSSESAKYIYVVFSDEESLEISNKVINQKDSLEWRSDNFFRFQVNHPEGAAADCEELFFIFFSDMTKNSPAMDTGETILDVSFRSAYDSGGKDALQFRRDCLPMLFYKIHQAIIDVSVNVEVHENVWNEKKWDFARHKGRNSKTGKRGDKPSTHFFFLTFPQNLQKFPKARFDEHYLEHDLKKQAFGVTTARKYGNSEPGDGSEYGNSEKKNQSFFKRFQIIPDTSFQKYSSRRNLRELAGNHRILPVVSFILKNYMHGHDGNPKKFERARIKRDVKGGLQISRAASYVMEEHKLENDSLPREFPSTRGKTDVKGELQNLPLSTYTTQGKDTNSEEFEKTRDESDDIKKELQNFPRSSYITEGYMQGNDTNSEEFEKTRDESDDIREELQNLPVSSYTMEGYMQGNDTNSEEFEKTRDENHDIKKEFKNLPVSPYTAEGYMQGNDSNSEESEKMRDESDGIKGKLQKFPASSYTVERYLQRDDSNLEEFERGRSKPYVKGQMRVSSVDSYTTEGYVDDGNERNSEDAAERKRLKRDIAEASQISKLLPPSLPKNNIYIIIPIPDKIVAKSEISFGKFSNSDGDVVEAPPKSRTSGYMKSVRKPIRVLIPELLRRKNGLHEERSTDKPFVSALKLFNKSDALMEMSQRFQSFLRFLKEDKLALRNH